jgi:hypothetical protein
VSKYTVHSSFGRAVTLLAFWETVMHFTEMFDKGQSVLQLRNAEFQWRVVLLDVFANTLQYKHNDVSNKNVWLSYWRVNAGRVLNTIV